jgi:hypothetical protein
MSCISDIPQTMDNVQNGIPVTDLEKIEILFKTELVFNMFSGKYSSHRVFFYLTQNLYTHSFPDLS